MKVNVHNEFKLCMLWCFLSIFCIYLLRLLEVQYFLYKHCGVFGLSFLGFLWWGHPHAIHTQWNYFYNALKNKCTVNLKVSFSFFNMAYKNCMCLWVKIKYTVLPDGGCTQGNLISWDIYRGCRTISSLLRSRGITVTLL